MTLTLSRRTLFLALLLLAATIVVLLVLPSSGEKAAQATPLPATATPEPWWAPERGSRGAEEQGSRGPEGQASKGEVTPAPPHPGTSAQKAPLHKVQPGDSLSGIAKQYDIAVEGLVELNKVKYPGLVDDPGVISVGWDLIVR